MFSRILKAQSALQGDGVIPMQDVPDVVELRRAVNRLGMVGATFPPTVSKTSELERVHGRVREVKSTARWAYTAAVITIWLQHLRFPGTVPWACRFLAIAMTGLIQTSLGCFRNLRVGFMEGGTG